jgi:oligoendopeptidase F
MYQDLSNNNIRAINTKLEEFITKIQNDIQFFELNLAKIPKEKQKELLSGRANGHSRLRKYHHFLSRIFANAQYMLSDKEERIMNLKSSPSHGNWVEMVDRFLSQEERTILDEEEKQIPATFDIVMNYMMSTKKNVRDTAAQAFNDMLAKHSDVAEVELNTVVTNKKINDTIRGMPRPDLGRHISDDIESEVVDTLLETVSKRYDIAHRFYKIKARLLGQTKLAYHERNVPVGSIEKEYSFEDSVAVVDRVFRSLDPQFSDLFQQLVQHGRLDVFPEKGKASSAFCARYLVSHPTYILLNHTNKLRDVLTIAHEVGHGINNELIKAKQHSLNFGVPLATAEVASTFMEDFVLYFLEKEADDKLRFSLQVMKLDQDISAIIRQVAGYRFEQELHQQVREVGYLSKQQIGELFQKHMKAYMGPAVESSPGSENWWIYWSHFRRFFYIYSYASGQLISKYLQRMVREDKKSIGKVKEFLSAGLSDSPRNIFNKLGIEISSPEFWNQGLDEVEKELKSLELRVGN